jgi:hypothetical protein
VTIINAYLVRMTYVGMGDDYLSLSDEYGDGGDMASARSSEPIMVELRRGAHVAESAIGGPMVYVPDQSSGMTLRDAALIGYARHVTEERE